MGDLHQELCGSRCVTVYGCEDDRKLLAYTCKTALRERFGLISAAIPAANTSMHMHQAGCIVPHMWSKMWRTVFALEAFCAQRTVVITVLPHEKLCCRLHGLFVFASFSFWEV